MYRMWLRYLIDHDAYVVPSAEELADAIMGTSDLHVGPARGRRDYLFQRKPVKRQIVKRRIDELDGNYAAFRRDVLAWLEGRSNGQTS